MEDEGYYDVCNFAFAEESEDYTLVITWLLVFNWYLANYDVDVKCFQWKLMYVWLMITNTSCVNFEYYKGSSRARKN